MVKIGKFETTKAGDLSEATGLHLLLYGEQGVGKTWLVGTAADSEYGPPVLHIDVDGGADTLTDHSDIEVFHPETFSELEKFIDELTKDRMGFRTIIVDTMSYAQKLCQEHVQSQSRKGDGLTQQDWGKVAESMTSIARKLKSMTSERGGGVNVLLTAWEMLKEDERTGRSQRLPMLSPATRVNVCGTAGHIGLLEVEYKKKRGESQVGDDTSGYDRVLIMGTRPNTVTRTRQPANGRGVPDVIKNPTMDQIIKLTKGIQE